MMIDKLIVNQVTRSPGHQVISIACCSLLLLLLSVTIAYATISPEKFSAADSGLHSPQVEISYSSLPIDSTLLDKKISTLKKFGFGSVLMTSIPAGSNSWDYIAGVAESCRRHSMKLGCEFFPQVDEPALLYRVDSTNRVINAGKQGKETKLSALNGDEHWITKFVMPVSYSNDIQRAFTSIQKISLLKEECVEYNFKAVPFEPRTINYLDRSVFEGSVNKFLLNAQMRMGNNYGTVLDLVRFPSLSENDLIWADNLPSWFFENTSFDFERYIPVLSWEKNIDSRFVKSARERYQRGIKRLWQENFADNVRPLVHEAGLNAAISVKRLGLPPEEYANCFQFPLASGSTGLVQRTLNRRTTGGARIHECSRLVGQVGANVSICVPVIDALFADGVNTLLFSEGIIGFSGSPRFNSLSALCNYVNRCSYVLLNSEPAQGILLCSDKIPPSMNRFVFDSVTPRMLKEAEIEKGRVVFTSGWSSSTVVVDDNTLRRSKTLFSKLRSAGVKVVPFSGVSELTPDFNWKSDVENLNFSFVHRTGLPREYFMLKNESDVGGMVNFVFKVNNFAKVSRWQPQDGKIFEISKFWKSSPTQYTLSMPVRPDELFFVVFDHESH